MVLTFVAGLAPTVNAAAAAASSSGRSHDHEGVDVPEREVERIDTAAESSAHVADRGDAARRARFLDALHALGRVDDA